MLPSSGIGRSSAMESFVRHGGHSLSPTRGMQGVFKMIEAATLEMERRDDIEVDEDDGQATNYGNSNSVAVDEPSLPTLGASTKAGKSYSTQEFSVATTAPMTLSTGGFSNSTSFQTSGAHSKPKNRHYSTGEATVRTVGTSSDGFEVEDSGEIPMKGSPYVSSQASESRDSRLKSDDFHVTSEGNEEPEAVEGQEAPEEHIGEEHNNEFSSVSHPTTIMSDVRNEGTEPEEQNNRHAPSMLWWKFKKLQKRKRMGSSVGVTETVGDGMSGIVTDTSSKIGQVGGSATVSGPEQLGSTVSEVNPSEGATATSSSGALTTTTTSSPAVMRRKARRLKTDERRAARSPESRLLFPGYPGKARKFPSTPMTAASSTAQTRDSSATAPNLKTAVTVLQPPPPPPPRNRIRTVSGSNTASKEQQGTIEQQREEVLLSDILQAYQHQSTPPKNRDSGPGGALGSTVVSSSCNHTQENAMAAERVSEFFTPAAHTEKDQAVSDGAMDIGPQVATFSDRMLASAQPTLGQGDEILCHGHIRVEPTLSMMDDDDHTSLSSLTGTSSVFNSAGMRYSTSDRRRCAGVGDGPSSTAYTLHKFALQFSEAFFESVKSFVPPPCRCDGVINPIREADVLNGTPEGNVVPMPVVPPVGNTGLRPAPQRPTTNVASPPETAVVSEYPGETMLPSGVVNGRAAVNAVPYLQQPNFNAIHAVDDLNVGHSKPRIPTQVHLTFTKRKPKVSLPVMTKAPTASKE